MAASAYVTRSHSLCWMLDLQPLKTYCCAFVSSTHHLQLTRDRDLMGMRNPFFSSLPFFVLSILFLNPVEHTCAFTMPATPSAASPRSEVLVCRKKSMQKAPSTMLMPLSSAQKTALGFCRLPFCKSCPPPVMFCGAVSGLSEDSDSETNLSISSDGETVKPSSPSSWKNSLLQASNFASALCVLDCTILPVVTVILPIFGIVAGNLEWLHQAGHAVALGFVLPVGGLATFINYYYAHRSFAIASLGVLGLLAVCGANVGCSVSLGGGAVGHALHKVLHYLHHGAAHRLANLAGCGLLLFSNYLSRRRQRQEGANCAHGPGCSHDK